MTALQPTPAPASIDLDHGQPVDQADIVTTAVGRRWLAVLRLATGFIFLWAFLDKTFGLGFSTPVERAWLDGVRRARAFSTAMPSSDR